MAWVINHLVGQIPLADALVALRASDLSFPLVLGAAVWWLLLRRHDIAKRAAVSRSGHRA